MIVYGTPDLGEFARVAEAAAASLADTWDVRFVVSHLVGKDDRLRTDPGDPYLEYAANFPDLFHFVVPVALRPEIDPARAAPHLRLAEQKLAILRRLGRFLAELVPPDTDRVAAPELGAVLLGGAVSMELGLPLVIVKKEPKQYGGARIVEGELHPGERVALIEDVTITGSQAIRAARVLADAGAIVNGVVVVLDREEGGAQRISEAGLRYTPLFRRQDLAID